MHALLSSRDSMRDMGRPGVWACLRTAFFALMLIASLFSAFIQPVSAAPYADDASADAAGQLDLQPLDPGSQSDRDGDGVPDETDTCPDVPNPDQVDSDGNGIGDACDAPPPAEDSDGDGIDDQTEIDNQMDPNSPDSDGDGIPDGEDPDPTVPQAPDEEPVAEPTSGLLPQQLAPGSITIRAWLCPDDGGVPTTVAQALSHNCNEPGDPINFFLTQNNFIVQSITVNVSGSGSFPMVEPGGYEINHSNAAAVQVAAFCEGNLPIGTTTKPYALVLSQPNTDLSLEVLGGEQIECDWFLVLEEQGESVDILNRKYLCPPDFDFLQVPNMTPQDWRNACQESVEDVTFTVTATNYAETRPADPNNNNTAVFEDVPVGQVSMTEEMPEGYYFLFRICQRYVGNDPVGEPQPGFDPEFNGAWEQGEARCEWFNIRPYAHLGILKLNCPEGLQYQGFTSPEDFLQDCTLPVEPPVEFRVTVGPDYDQTVATDPNVNNWAAFRNLPAGQATIEELLPEGYEVIRRYCGSTPPIIREPITQTRPAFASGSDTALREAQAAVPQYTEYPVEDGPITLDLAPGYIWGCIYINMPVQEYTVTLYKWECEPGTMPNQPVEYYQGALPDQETGPCETERAGVDFTLSDGNGTTSFTSDTNGVEIPVVPDANGNFTISEIIPQGYGDPFRNCLPLNPPEPNGGQPPAWQTGGMGPDITVSVIPGEYDYQCWYYNIPYDYGDVTVYNWECPEGVTPDATFDAYSAACTVAMPNVEFSLSAQIGLLSFTPQVTDAAGMVHWEGVPGGPLSIAESVPPGYDPNPFAACRVEEPSPVILLMQVVGTDWTPMDSINGVVNVSLQDGYDLECHYFNRYLGPGQITAYKYTCPEGYDRSAWGANPMVDCTSATNGVTFVLDQPSPEVDLQSDTGDSVNGAVSFGGLAPGDYVLTEVVPEGTHEVFIWNCVGINTSSVHPAPLAVGPEVTIRVAGGDRIECYYFNVPARDPGYGWMVVRKFNCTTPAYVSDVECYTYEGGQGFEVQAWNGSTWVTVQSGTTNVAGTVTFTNLEPGDYRLAEPGAAACLMKSSNITPNNNIGVVEGMETTVHVYNCSQPTKTPGKPTKYPNTGVEPIGDVRTSPDDASVGVLALAASAAISRRAFLKRAAIGAAAGVTVVGGGGVALGRVLAFQTLVPLDATITPEGSPAATPPADCMYPATPEPVAGSPESMSPIQALDPEATPSGTPGTSLVCARGAIPVHLVIPVIGVDIGIEYLEIIDGEMQQPTGADAVAWYKTTARLGEQGNAIFAGHLNWWNMPEGPFFLLETLTEGDVVEVEGDDGETYRYLVQWTQDFPIDEEPPEEALGQTEEEAITLITCGGEWDADVALYDHRTLVRAIRDTSVVPGTPPS